MHWSRTEKVNNQYMQRTSLTLTYELVIDLGQEHLALLFTFSEFKVLDVPVLELGGIANRQSDGLSNG
jgi:hypothetical protein